MKRNKNRYISTIISICTIVLLLLTVVQPAHASAITFSNAVKTGTFNVPKTGSLTPIRINDSITISSTSNFSDGYLLLKNTGAGSTTDEIGLLSDANLNAFGAISQSGNQIYLGTGGSKKLIGSVDAQLDGKAGRDLMIRFSTPLPNGGFENDFLQWEKKNQAIRLPGDAWWQSHFTFWGKTYERTPKPSTSIEVIRRTVWPPFNASPDGSDAYLRMAISGWLDKAYGTLHGPAIVSKPFEAERGDKVSLYFNARDIGDDYDVYGYLRDSVTGATQTLFYERGKDTNGWKAAEATINLPSSSNFVFEFLCGSYDRTGGHWIGSEFLIDGVRVVSNLVNAQVVSNIARKVAFIRTSQVPRTNAADRRYVFEAKNSAGQVSTSSASTVKIHTYPTPPTLTLTPTPGSVDKMDISWSSNTGATSYTIRHGGTTLVNNLSTTSYQFTGLTANTAYAITALATNNMGSSDEITVTRYTNAAVPTLAATSASTSRVELQIGNNGNPQNTRYRLERSVQGSNTWTVIEDFTMAASGAATIEYTASGLAANTTYLFRIKARNGDGVHTAYSGTVTRQTAPQPPDPVSVTAKAGTTDSLDIAWWAPPGATAYDVFRNNVAINSDFAGNDVTHNGLIPNTPYTVYVYANNAGGTSDISQSVTAYTMAEVPHLTLDSATIDSITMSIDNRGNPENTLYALQRSSDGVNFVTIEDFTIRSLEGAPMSYVSPDLQPGTTYYYRIKARNGDLMETAYSPVVGRITRTLAPTGVTVTAVPYTTDTLAVTWTAPIGAAGFDVFRKAVGEAEFTKTDANITEPMTLHDGLTPNRQYEYYIVAKNASGDSAPSQIGARYTFAKVPGITSENVGSVNNLTIAPEGNPIEGSAANPDGTYYKVEYSTDDGTSWTDLHPVGILDPPWTYLLEPQHDNIEPGLIYAYRVKARNGDGVETDYSGSASARSNEDPVITITSPASNVYRSHMDGFTGFIISGTVQDDDNDTVRISATIDGKTRTTSVAANAAGVPWSLVFDAAADSIAAASYTITVTGNDGFGGLVTTNWAYVLYVDTTGPDLPGIVPATTAWTNAAAVGVTITPGTDGGAGTATTEYRLTGATTLDWTEYDGFSITNAGVTTIEARSTDNVGNVGGVQSATVKIDRTPPTGTGLGVVSTEGDTSYTRSTIVNIVDIGASESGGAGDGAGDPSLPYQMQLSNTADFVNPSSWEAYAATRNNWTLSAGVGEKTVYLRFIDFVGNISQPISGTIIFDNEPPVIEISPPSRFNAKKGVEISYEITINKPSSLAGINAADKSKVDLAVLGSISDADKTTLINGITIDDVSANKRKINIAIPHDFVGEGTIGLTILAEAATDLAGNKSARTVANASFVIDAIAPDNQDELFPESTTMQGGRAVTLAKRSIDSEGGYDSDSVRFAPAGYDGAAPANGVTITSTHGSSLVINAPTGPGEYRLYVLDAAGNMSPASTAVLTVKNTGPQVTVTGPTPSHVNAGLSVDYVVTYSADAHQIDLAEEHVALVTTGTANAYVDITAVDGQSLQRRVTLRNLMGEGTVQIRIAGGSAADAFDNLAMESDVSDPVYVDNTPPELESGSIVSNNGENVVYGKKGDIVTVSLMADEDLATVTGTVAGTAVTFSIDGSDRSWKAEYTIPEDSSLDALDGQILPVSITMTDLAGNEKTISEADFLEKVTLDFTSPTVELVGEKDTEERYKTAVQILFGAGTAILTNTDTTEEQPVESGAIVFEEGSYSVTVTNRVGVTTSAAFTISYDSIMLAQDIEALAIGYAAGDHAGSVTQNVTLPAESLSGASVAWEVVSGAAVNAHGAVTRPAHDAGDQAVQLKATITRGPLSSTKNFSLKVRALPDPEGGLAEVREDAQLASIKYAFGDAANHVTFPVELAAVGTVNQSIITWTSDREDVIQIEDEPLNGWYQTTVTRPADADVVVKLTATATAIVEVEGEEVTRTADHDFFVTVKKYEPTDSEKVLADFDHVRVEYRGEDNEFSVTQDVDFIADGPYHSQVTWQSSHPGVVSTNGTVTRPTARQGNKTVNITATISSGSAAIEKHFEMIVIRSDSTVSPLDEDHENLAVGYYGADHAGEVTTHVILPASGDKGSQISWASSNTDVIAADGTVTRPTTTSAAVTLTATLDKQGETRTKEFVLTVLHTDNSDVLQQIYDDTEGLFIGYAVGDNAGSVTLDVLLRTRGANGSIIEWSSSHDAILSSTGGVNRQSQDVAVTLTASIKKYAEEIGYWVHRAKVFNVNVVNRGTAVVDVVADLDDIEIIYATGDHAGAVRSSVFLPTVGKTGSTVTWTSGNPSVISDSGKVTRPHDDLTDAHVTLRAEIAHPITGQTEVKLFDLVVLKMTDDETVRKVARDLRPEDLFTFTGNDSWESVTSDSWLLNSGKDGVAITWTTNKPSVIEVGAADPTTGLQEALVSRTDQVQMVILTATFRLNLTSVTNHYMLIVQPADASKNPEETRRTSVRSSEISSPAATQTTPVMETIVDRGGETVRIDTIVLEEATVRNIVDQVNPQAPIAERTLNVRAERDISSPAHEQAVDITGNVVVALTEKNMKLVLDSDIAVIELEPAALSSLTSLYFRLVPIQNVIEQQSLVNELKTMAGSNIILHNIPCQIEANYRGVNTYVTIPFGSAVISNFDRLRVFVRHDDELKSYQGTVVMRNGSPYGIRIMIDKFSQFQIYELPAPAPAPGTAGSRESSIKELLEELEKEGKVVLENEGVKVEIPQNVISLRDLLEILPGGANEEDVSITIHIGPLSGSPLEESKKIFGQAGLNLVGVPVRLAVNANYLDQEIQLAYLNQYVKIYIPIPEGQKITTGIRLNEDGSWIHIPTEVTIINGQYYARLNSLITGTFGLIWNPREMEDVHSNWHKTAINNLYSRTVVRGVSDSASIYMPDRGMTRAEFATIMIRALGLLPGIGDNPYSDIAEGAWYTGFIKTATSYQLIKGYPDGSFRPNDTITREQAAVMLARAAQLTGLYKKLYSWETEPLLQEFTDRGQISGYAVPGVAQGVYHNILRGHSDKRLAPKDDITRGEIATVLQRLLQQSQMID